MKTLTQKKIELIKALEQERDRLHTQHGSISKDHNLAISYLKTGDTHITNTERFEILDACINDLEGMFTDYLN